MPTQETVPNAPDRRIRSAIALSVVMPCYNEADHIEETLRAWTDFLKDEVESFEILVVNDGSTDGTGRVLDRIRKETPTLRVIHQLNGGKEAALRRGYEAARGTYILQTESNGRFDPADFVPFWENRSPDTLLLARRDLPREGWLYQAQGRSVRALVKLLFGAEWQEPEAPFRLISRTCLQSHLSRLPRGFAQVNLGLTLLAHMDNPGGIRELAVPYRFRTGPRRRVSLWWLAGTLVHLSFDLAHLRLSLLRPKLAAQPAAHAN